ncbi:hypothetical protein POSPLADRAFT_1150140 [Postia placenta MAD-698-R-SB12]|uniref:EVE domain-containing protein n=1 Tax=Postia placenta MAD-698-R-SB12 TaxID=670580 RepID=A0A1X6MTG7_9APHY|nr:hypothetical protein POSPLADRAFT_1150140 [Postia placenta MAD-698-R-SB12]OSX59516.1 hypothetical protein POSPLADRAFT_1150140 [Postia placenta MAD-698-R-SB12]
MSPKYWLMKAEPDSRIVKEKDVKFSVDDFDSVKTTPWEGVRNAEARNLMKEMKVGDKVLFYHSNCKTPEAHCLSQVSQEAYPDYTAWDPSHPYYDAKTDKDNPKWYMVDVTFVARTAHFVSLALLRRIAGAATDDTPEDVGYIHSDGVKAIKQMALVTRGRLSVQRVEEKTWNVVQLLAENGGWEESDTAPKARGKGGAKKTNAGTKKKAAKEPDEEGEDADAEEVEGIGGEDDRGGLASRKTSQTAGRKRKTRDADGESAAVTAGLRRSTRARK